MKRAISSIPLSALPEIMHLYRYSKFSSLLTSLSRQGKFQLIILQSLPRPFPDLSLARRIRQYDRRVPIIIVTDNESLCLEGYDVPISPVLYQGHDGTANAHGS